ncbi:hypothetical protein ACFV9E_42815, partial [Streptomyces sp. NPDC059835]
SLALKAGGVVSWGSDRYDATTVPAAAKNDVAAIATGQYFSPALKNSSVLAWSEARKGQTEVPEDARTGVTAIVAGAHHALAPTTDGEVIAWGRPTSPPK